MKYEECKLGQKVRLKSCKTVMTKWIGTEGIIEIINNKDNLLSIQVMFSKPLAGLEVNYEWFSPSGLENV